MVRLCWLEAGLWNNIDTIMDSCDSFAQLFFASCDNFNGDQCTKFCMVLWSIWRRINEKFWDNRDSRFKEAVYHAEENLHMWRWPRVVAARCA